MLFKNFLLIGGGEGCLSSAPLISCVALASFWAGQMCTQAIVTSIKETEMVAARQSSPKVTMQVGVLRTQAGPNSYAQSPS
jgi:hypothetical protein